MARIESGVSASNDNSTFGVRDFSGTLLARNTVFNLLGQVVPLVLAVVAIPFLIRYMGTERFGVLTLAWMVSGYFSLFDLGVGRATTKFVADYRAQGRVGEMKALVTTSLLILTGIGILFGVITLVATPWLVIDLLNIPLALQRESLTAFFLLAAAVPFTVLTAGARGVLEAEQRFGIINIVKVPFSAATFLLPLVVLLFTVSLVPIIAMLVASRVVVLAIYLWYCRQHLTVRRDVLKFERSQLRRLLGYGGWLTISQLIPPMMGSMDRFFIGSILTMTAVAYYATPFDTIAKLAVIPNSMVGVLFPVFSVYALDQLSRLNRMHERAIAYIMLVMSPAAVILIGGGDIVLRLWLGTEFADNGTTVIQLLAIGLFVSSAARVSGNVIQAAGRPDLTAKLFMAELPVYIVLLIVCTRKFGIAGAASVWLGHVVVETVLLYIMCRPLMGLSSDDFYRYALKLSGWLTGCVGVSILVFLVEPLGIRVTGLIVATVGIPLVGSRWLLDHEERVKLRETLVSLSRIKKLKSELR